MNRTSIEWVKNPDGSQGYTWNPITGCLNGCEYCYARKLAKGRLRSRYLANENIAPVIDNRNLAENYIQEEASEIAYSQRIEYAKTTPFYPRFWEDRLGEPVKGYTRTDYGGSNAAASNKGIFVCDMSDLFGIGIPEEWTKKVLGIIERCHYHRFYLLTKQPQNLIKWSPFPDNCWVGVSATDDSMFRIGANQLRQIDASIRYISFEPLLSWEGMPSLRTYNWLASNHIKWVIIGSQTKPYKPPKIEWVKEIGEACDKAGIPIFLKDNLKPLLTSSFGGKDVIESHNLWAFKYFKLRQEMPG